MTSELVGIDGNQLQQEAGISDARAASAIAQLECIDPDEMLATRYNVLVRMVDEIERTEAGVLLPATYFTKFLFDKTRCVLLKAGPEAFTGQNGKEWQVKPKIGDTIYISKNAGNVYRDKDVLLHRLIDDVDVRFVVES